MKPFKFDKKTDNLFKAILSLRSIKEAEKFFRDLCTAEELRAIAERWEIVRLLNQGLTYRKIAQQLDTSTTTVGRVADWYSNGEGGYQLIFNRLNMTHCHNSSSTGKEL